MFERYLLFLETVSLALPFCLLLCMVLLPYFVLLLERKPCVFALFLLFGLYVNDMIESINQKIKKVKPLSAVFWV